MKTKLSKLTGKPIPLCRCGKCVYASGKCYGCYQRECALKVRR